MLDREKNPVVRKKEGIQKCMLLRDDEAHLIDTPAAYI